MFRTERTYWKVSLVSEIHPLIFTYWWPSPSHQPARLRPTPGKPHQQNLRTTTKTQPWLSLQSRMSNNSVRAKAGGVPTSARHELKSDVVELLLWVPESQDEADGNAGVGHSWILWQKDFTLKASAFISLYFLLPFSSCLLFQRSMPSECFINKNWRGVGRWGVRLKCGKTLKVAGGRGEKDWKEPEAVNNSNTTEDRTYRVKE